MSFDHLRQALRATTPTANARLVLIYLADYASDAGEAWPSVPTLAKRTSLAPRTVRDALRRLEAAGLIRTTERRGRNTSNLYKLTLGGTSKPAGDAAPDEKPAGDAAQTGTSCRSKPAGDAANPRKGTSHRTSDSPPPPESLTAPAREARTAGPMVVVGSPLVFFDGGGAQDPAVVADDADAMLVKVTQAAGLDPFDPTTAETWRGSKAREALRGWRELADDAAILDFIARTPRDGTPAVPWYFSRSIARLAAAVAAGAEPAQAEATHEARRRRVREAAVQLNAARDRGGWGSGMSSREIGLAAQRLAAAWGTRQRGEPTDEDIGIAADELYQRLGKQ